MRNNFFCYMKIALTITCHALGSIASFSQILFYRDNAMFIINNTIVIIQKLNNTKFVTFVFSYAILFIDKYS